jgi:hypothetical protein
MAERKPFRFGRHLVTDHRSAGRAFPPMVMQRIGAAIGAAKYARTTGASSLALFHPPDNSSPL